MYGLLIDKDVYLPKEYYQLLLTPKREYYNTIELIKKGENVSFENIKNKIEFSFMEAEQIKNESQNKKINMKWFDYKNLINAYIERIFNNYIPVHEYEEKHGWEMKVNVDGWSENNYLIKYFCKSLTGYMRNYIRDSKPKEIIIKKCTECGKDIKCITNMKKYCEECAKEKEKIRKRNWKRNNKNNQK
jgi:hypothetical protein